MIKLNGKEVVFKKFPNGETYFDSRELIYSDSDDTIMLKYESDQDLFNLFMLKTDLESRRVSLEITYLPYSRMDRKSYVMPFSLSNVCKFINDLNFIDVEILEPHSDVCLNLLNNCIYTEIIQELTEETLKRINFDKITDFICYPDISSYKRYSEYFNGYNYFLCLKERNFETGELIIIDIHCHGNTKNIKNIVMVDDLCSRGGTFAMTKNSICNRFFASYTKFHLVVAHCEDTIYEGDVLEEFESVTTTDSILKNFSSGRIHAQRLFSK